MVDMARELLYRGMYYYVVPLCVRGEGFVSAWEDFTLFCGQPLGSRVPEVKPTTASLTSGDGVMRVPPLYSSPDGGCEPWAFVGFGADLLQ